MSKTDMITLGEISRPHGVRGEVKLKSFTEDPCAIGAYGVLVTERGEKVTLKNVRLAQDHVIARIEGVTDRDAADRLKGRKLQVDRAALPDDELDEDEAFIADLIGLPAIDGEGKALGEIVAVQNYGAGDLIEIAVPGKKATLLLPFTDDVVVEIGEDAVVIDASEGSVASAFIAPPSKAEIAEAEALAAQEEGAA